MTPAWTNIPKPQESSVSSLSGGEPIGLLLALTYTVVGSSVISGWTDIQKPTTASWVTVAKPATQGWTNISKPTS